MLRKNKLIQFVVFAWFGCFLFVSCSKKEKNTPIRTKRQITIPKIFVPVVFPYQGEPKEVLVKKGDTLDSIATEFYGERSYATLIALKNHIEDERNIQIGAKLSLPTLHSLLLDEKKLSVFLPEFEQVLQAFQLYQNEQLAIKKIAYSFGEKRSSGLPFSKKTIQSLQDATALLEDALQKMRQKEPLLPSRVLNQMNSMVGDVSRLSLGMCDPECYELSTIHQHLMLWTNYLITWAQKRNENVP